MQVTRVLLFLLLLIPTYGSAQSGSVQEEHDDGTYSVGIRDENGYQQGKWIKFYSTGKEFIVANYIKDTLEGQVISYYKNGQIQAENAYLNGKLNGVSRQYDIKGRKIREISYKNNLIYGNCIYYEDDIIYSERYYKNGKENGPAKDYDSKGRITHEYTILPTGERVNNICYDKNGKKINCNFF